METIRNKISNETQMFLDKLAYSLDTTLYYYGSIQRYDYYPGKSDIDIDIFADNVSSMKYNLKHFLQKRNGLLSTIEFSSFVLKTNEHAIIKGYKLAYKEKKNGLFLELNIFDSKHKEEILKEHAYKTYLPLHIMILLTLIKFMHYSLPILSINNYRTCKEFCLNYLLNGRVVEFVNMG